MKKRILFIFPLLFSLLGTASSQEIRCEMENTAFKAGERVDYAAYFQWGAIKIDKLRIETSITAGVYEQDSIYDITVIGVTEKTMRNFFSLQDTVNVKVKKEGLTPVYFWQHDTEKRYKATKEHFFSRTEDGMRVVAEETRDGKPAYSGKTFFKGECPMDALSLLFRVRNLDFSDAVPGQHYPFSFFSRGESVLLNIIFEKRDTVTLRNGTSYDCFKFQLQTTEGSVFSSKEKTYIWLSNDVNRLIVHVESKLKVGYVKLDIVSAKNTLSPLRPSSVR